ncbi:Uncharacterised protein [Amycolatopsis camponoti]|uniref:Uncharacterized protein n=1 Tax=Amycolatopsis camponoti TaxID=2606593 RepID=A0A6I8M5Z6_9PSEU|nr:Uncharacterised protein [Amycolatopsis camponoti]
MVDLAAVLRRLVDRFHLVGHGQRVQLGARGHRARTALRGVAGGPARRGRFGCLRVRALGRRRVRRRPPARGCFGCDGVGRPAGCGPVGGGRGAAGCLGGGTLGRGSVGRRALAGGTGCGTAVGRDSGGALPGAVRARGGVGSGGRALTGAVRAGCDALGRRALTSGAVGAAGCLVGGALGRGAVRTGRGTAEAPGRLCRGRRLLRARVHGRRAALERGLGQRGGGRRAAWLPRPRRARLTSGVRGYWVLGGRLRCPRARLSAPCRSRGFGGSRPVSGLVGTVLARRDRANAGGLGDDVRDADPALVLHRPASAGPGPRGTVRTATGSRAVVLVRHSVSFRAIEGGWYLAVFPRER